LQKIREKERENRDYKSREKYSGKNCLLIRVVSDFISSGIFRLNFLKCILLRFIIMKAIELS
jgi:hypothetical protein